MILDWVVGPFLKLLADLIGVLPTGGQSLFGATPVTIADAVVPYIRFAAYILPMQDILGMMMVLVGFWYPALLTYNVARYVYASFPDIAGFGS